MSEEQKKQEEQQRQQLIQTILLQQNQSSTPGEGSIDGSQLHEHMLQQHQQPSGGSTGGCGDSSDGHDDEDVENGFEIPQRFTKSGRKRAVPFPMKLMKVLSNKKFKHIITWMPSGKSFTILKPKAFVAEILPEHFKSAKYSSFTRKLHRWGFMRHYRGEEAGAFYHKDFQKDDLDLAEKMTCHKVEPSKAAGVVKKTMGGVQKLDGMPGSLSGLVHLDGMDRTGLGEDDMKQPSLAGSLANQAIQRQQILAGNIRNGLGGNMGAINGAINGSLGAGFGANVAGHSLPNMEQQREQRRVPTSLPPDIMLQLQRQQQQLRISEQPPSQQMAPTLDAVIELEVNRRLKERIRIAASARHHQSLMQGQAGLSATNSAAAAAQARHQHQHAHHHAHRGAGAQPSASTLAWNNIQGQTLRNVLVQMEIAKRQGTLDPTLLALATGNFSRLGGNNNSGEEDLPRTNIQGARTA